jgi:4-amino-4-deoxy-L-arabinose transferase-like glycosyltransferase
MPDIGLLQGSRPRVAAPPVPVITPDAEPVSEIVAAPGREVAAPFMAPVASAIAAISAEPGAEVVSTPAAVVPAATAPVAIAPAAAAPVQGATHPSVPTPSAQVHSVASGAAPRETPRTGSRIPAAPPASLPPIRGRDLLWLALALFIIVGTGLGMRDPWPADEPRFAVLARDMAMSHEWLFPRVGGDLYQDKPPLYFWLLAICYTIFGSVKASFLIPSFLAAGGILFLIYDFGRRTVGREAGLAAALITVCTLQFVTVTRGAQIDATLCFLTTLSLYSLLRHLLLGPAWGWYFLGGFAAGLGVFTKGVGFLPVLLMIPYFALRGTGWKGLAVVDAGRLGWRWWLAPLAMLFAISLWFVPMLIAAASGSAEYAAYRDEILFKQTVGRYAAAWHHVKPWYYFLVEVIPALWLPWSLLLFWLVPRFKAAFHERNAHVWLPLLWIFVVVLFFSWSPGKRGIYVFPALPALAIASLPFLASVLARAGVRRAGFVLGGAFFVAAAVLAIAYAAHAKFAVEAIAAANLGGTTALYIYLLLCGAGLVFAFFRAPLVAWPVAIGSLAIVFSYFIAPAMNGERSGRDFTRAMLTKVKPEEQLALVDYKEQFLLYLDRTTVNFGHRRGFEGAREFQDAAAWLNAGSNRVLLMPADTFTRSDTGGCFVSAPLPDEHTLAGESSDEQWYLVRGKASPECAAKGDAGRAIVYAAKAP